MKKIMISDMTLKVTSEEKNEVLTFRDKTHIARQLDSLGVDAIELSAIKNGKEDIVINRTIASAVKNCMVKIPAGFSSESIEEAYESIRDAKNPCIEIIVPTSTVQMEYTLHMKAPKALELVKTLCAKAKEKCNEVEFVASDASRADRDFLVQICMAAEESGATYVTLCDDAGILLPEEFADMVREVKEKCNAKIGIQPSDAMGMAAASVIASFKAGADMIKTSVSGFSAEKIADIIRLRGDDLGISCGLSSTEMHRGITDVEKKIESADITSAKTEGESVIALDSANTLTDVCKASEMLGYELSDEDNGKVYEEFERLIQKKKTIGSKELEAMIASSAMQVPSTYHLDSYVSNSGNVITATAHVTLIKNGEKISGVSIGDGPIDAAFLAIEQIVGHHYELDDFQIQSVTEGREAVGSALVRLRSSGKLYSGNGVSTDIIGASIRAFLNALNKIVYEEK